MAGNGGVASFRTRSPESPRGTAPRVVSGPLSWLIRAAFVVFVSSMPFEAALVGREGYFSISKLVGYVFLGLALLQPKLCFRKPPRALWWFALYFGLYMLMGLYQPSVYRPEISLTTFRLAQCLVLLWVGYNLLREERLATWCLWGFGLACVAVAGLLTSGVGASQYRGLASRQTVFGQSPNTLSALIALGAVALIGLAYARAGARKKAKFAAWAGFLLVAVAITRAGSRGALIGLGLGLLTLLASGGSARTRMRNALIVVLALGACVWITMTTATSASRWQATLEEGHMSGRQPIYVAAFRMFTERPILGWGPVTNFYVLGRELSRPKMDTHNLFLWLLTEQGLVGTLPFCIGLAVCAGAAWRARRSPRGLLPLALLVAILTVNLSGTYYVAKWFWFILAYCLASDPRIHRRRTESRLMSANRLESGRSYPAAAIRPPRRGREWYRGRDPLRIG